VYCNTSVGKYNPCRGSEASVSVKVNSPKVLAEELGWFKRRGVLNMGLATDPYQPVERKYRITGQILEVLKEHNCPFAIGTKSDLILRDLDLISEASKKFHCCISFSMGTLDGNLAKLLEPNAPSPKRRLEAMKRFAAKGVLTGIWLTPIIPYLTDDEENLGKVISAAVENGAKFVLGGSLDMRNPVGFKIFLEKNFASLVPKFEKLYRWQNKTVMYYPDEFYLYRLYDKFISICQKLKVESYIPHFRGRGQAWNYYIRNLTQLGDQTRKLTQLLNYSSPYQEFLQTVCMRLGDKSISGSLLRILGYFPH
jgi:DNA repair photolyase